MNKKLALFPMTRDLCAVARYSHLLKGYTLTAALVPPALKLNDIDICKIDGGTAAGILLSDYSVSKINDCDVIFLDYNENLPYLPLYQEVIDCANKQGKEVVLSRQLSVRLGLISVYQPFSEMRVEETLFECKIPVIAVLTQGLHTNQFAVELALRNHFLSQGYSVGQIGTHEAGIFFGFHKQPSFLYENRDASEKILLYNKYVKELECAENPDLLVLGV